MAGLRGRRWAAVMTAAIMAVVGIAVASPAVAADPAPIDKVSDPATFHEYPGSGTPSYFQQSRNPGRIWTDKTVFTDRVPMIPEFQEEGVPELEIGGDEMVVALSALGATRHVRGERQVPIDVSMVLDNSRSMVQCVGSSADCLGANTWRDSRAYAMAEAVNAAIGIIAEDNPDNRVSLVEFGNVSSVLHTMGPPRRMANGDYVTLRRTTPPGGAALELEVYGGQTITIGGVPGNYQSTNIHRGIATGMDQLARQSPASVTGENQRIPNLILFSDGEPTLSSSATSWWAPTAATQGPAVPGDNQYYGNGFLAAMAGAYLKNRGRGGAVRSERPAIQRRVLRARHGGGSRPDLPADRPGDGRCRPEPPHGHPGGHGHHRRLRHLHGPHRCVHARHRHEPPLLLLGA